MVQVSNDMINEKDNQSKGYFPLSIEQETLWLDQLLVSEEAKDALVTTTSFKIIGEVDFQRLKEVFLGLVATHPALNNKFILIDDIPMQEKQDVFAQHEMYGSFYDLSNRTLEEAQFIIDDSFKNIIDITTQVIDFKLFKLSNGEHKCVIYTHHIMSDHETLVNIIKEFFDLYEKMDDGTFDRTKIKPIERNKEILLQRREKQVDNPKALEYWKNIFQEEIDDVKLPQDFPHPREESGYGKLLIKKISGKSYEKLYMFAMEKRVTPFLLLTSIYQVLLYKLSQNNKIPLFIGLGTRNKDTKNEMGIFC